MGENMIKRKDGRWQEQIKLPGMERPKYFYGRTQREVQRKLAAWSMEREQEQAQAVQLCTIVEQWAERHQEEISASSWQSYPAFEGLLRSEIKKVEKFAQKRDGKDSKLTGYGYHETEDAIGFITVKCEICSNDMRDRERDVILYVFVPDRRKSFISKALSR